MTDEIDFSGVSDSDIAVVGMAAHLPGAPDINRYWANLVAGTESIRALSEAELLAAGESPAKLRKPNYVPSAAILDKFEHFDADFFGFSPKEAGILDPQHRQFLEVAWESLENAGHPPEHFAGQIGVYAGCGMGSYFYFNICSNTDLVDQTGMFLLRHTGNDKDFLATRVSHIFDLKGPSINVQTACSTSLVAVHFASQALLNGECDMALAGGVTIELPHARGYLYTEGEILSPDGHCHAFDHRAQGTVFGSGAGCVVLRRAKDAMRDGDHIWAIIKGTAVNNDGAAKAGYLAPSVEGQARCIAEAQAIAGVRGADVSYVECHGTGTYLGDPIEVAALTQAFRQSGEDSATRCRIGSVKTNIGHLDTAAGVASLIKVALSLHHRQLPPSLGFEAPNPEIGFENTPFAVNDTLTPWHSDTARLAGVNSLGVGGTNAHVVLQQAPKRSSSEESPWPFQPIVISAKSKPALENAAQQLAQHLRENPEQNLADIAYTLKEGRKAFDRRRVVVAETNQEAAALLEANDMRRVFSHEDLGPNPEVVFMFPGGGAQYAGMARDLYQTEPVFADWMDNGLAILQPKLDYDIRALWLPDVGQEAAANDLLKRPSVQLPLIMITEYALAQLYQSWGVNPAILVGHSMGENTAACLAGVMSFEDCVGLVHLRGTLFDQVPAGGMLSVPLAQAALRPLLTHDLDIASVNAPSLCVVSGPDASLVALAERLTAQEIDTHRIAIDIAAHSKMLEPILADFQRFLEGIALHPPQLPIVSNRSGQTLTDAEATSPAYWVAHLRNTVNFEACMATLQAQSQRVYVEMGPGRAMTSLAQANGVAQSAVVPALRHPDQVVADDIWHMTSLARLWACGVVIDWQQIWGDARRNKVVLPSYAFQRKPYFIEARKPQITAEQAPLERIENIEDWGWKPHWKPTSTGIDLSVDLEIAPPKTWLFFLDTEGVAEAAATKLRIAGHRVTTVRAGDAFFREAEDRFVIAPERGREGYDQLLRELIALDRAPDHIVHAWLLTQKETFRAGSSFLHRNLEYGFYSAMYLAQVIGDEDLARPLHITFLTTQASQVKSEPLRYPEKATILGPLRVIPRELPAVTVSACDFEWPQKTKSTKAAGETAALVDLVLEELLCEPHTRLAAVRDGRRYEQMLRSHRISEDKFTFKRGAHVFITGGFGGIGLTVAELLVQSFGAKITLVGRSLLPARAAWANHLQMHGPNQSVSRRIMAVQRLEGLGAEVEIVAADVTDYAKMLEAKSISEQRFGKIGMVIHAAGFVADAPLMTKTALQAGDVLAPKVHGTLVLDRLFPDGSLDYLVLFASSSTATGPAGQIDYIAANEFLNSYSKMRAGGKTKVISLNWGIWSGVGMAADALESRLGTRKKAISLPVRQAMLDAASFDLNDNRTYTASFDTNCWFINGHRFQSGQAVMPGTGYFELIAEAMQEQGVTEPFEIRDLYFFRALDVPEVGRREIRVILEKTPEGFDFSVHFAHPIHSGDAWVLLAQAQINLATRQSSRLDLNEIAKRLPDAEVGLGLKIGQEKHLEFGLHWRVLNKRSYNETEGLAELALPRELQAETQNFLMHPALLDIATGWAMELITGYTPESLWVPVSYEKVRIFRNLPPEIRSWVRNAGANRATDGEARFDVTVTTPNGEIILEIVGFKIRRLSGTLEIPEVSSQELIFDDAEVMQNLSPAEERLRHTYALGITAAEGGQAFLRAIAGNGSQIYVSSLDLPELAAQAQMEVVSEQQRHGFERPDLDSTFVAPRNDIEQTIAEFWQQLLGIDQVGVEDSFFDLGGHSLIAVRLFAMIKKTYRVEFPISVLFAAPTVSACAALTAAEIGLVSENSEIKQTAPTRQFTYLVQMNQGGDRRKTPFFLVAGMFGNVMNLRDLSQQLDRDRAFFGIQARGLLGQERPHETLALAATDYIAEMRVVQPHGPYLVGGFSGGGLTAWEIARQLEADGEQVALLVLLDTPLPMRPTLSRTDKILIKLAEFKEKGPAYLVEWARKRWQWEHSKRQETKQEVHTAAFQNLAIEAAFLAALPQFQMKRRDGMTVLFRPVLDRHWRVSGKNWVSKAKEYVFEDNQLGPFATALQIVEVPGDHDSMVLEPNVRVLAAKLREAIDVAEDEQRKRSALIQAAE
jgi:acyl transferase domain-containing protein/thioesterase domain-containing protein/acyl carrier protein